MLAHSIHKENNQAFSDYEGGRDAEMMTNVVERMSNCE